MEYIRKYIKFGIGAYVFMTGDEAKVMFESFQGLDVLDQRGFFVFMSQRLEEGTFGKLFKEYMDLAEVVQGK